MSITAWLEPRLAELATIKIRPEQNTLFAINQSIFICGNINTQPQEIRRQQRKKYMTAGRWRAVLPAISSAATSGVKSISKLHLYKSIVSDGKTTRSKVESIDQKST